ncbi:hypothetical protein GCK32_020088, partial [Trichostrongylus colubriformis]
ASSPDISLCWVMNPRAKRARHVLRTSPSASSTSTPEETSKREQSAERGGHTGRRGRRRKTHLSVHVLHRNGFGYVFEEANVAKRKGLVYKSIGL